MSRRGRAALAAAALAACGVIALWPQRRPPPALQPIAFSHRSHAESQVECVYCHPGALIRARAGIPQARECASCHRPGRSQDPEILKIEQQARRRDGIAWARVARLPKYNLFSHRAHARAGVDCAVCHPQVSTMDQTRQALDFEMDWCVDCHERQAAGVDCLTCHM